MNHDLKSKVALVTGGSRGIGRAIALRLSRDGAAVAVNYASNAAEAEKTVAEIKATGGTAVAVRADVGRVTEVTRMFDETLAAFGKLDILVKNVGVMFIKPITDVTEEELAARSFARTAAWPEVFRLQRKWIQRKMTAHPVTAGNGTGDELFGNLHRTSQIVPQSQRRANGRRVGTTRAVCADAGDPGRREHQFSAAVQKFLYLE